MGIINKLKENALALKKRIVLPEGHDDRVIEAAVNLTKGGYAEVILLGDADKVYATLKKSGLKNMPEIIDPQCDGRLENFAGRYYEKRKNKGMTETQALVDMKAPVFFGAMLTSLDFADGCVAGAATYSSDVSRAALRIIGVNIDTPTLSSFMIMETERREFGGNGTLLFADIAVNINPDEQTLSNIAIATSDTWVSLMGSEAKTALLSFSTKGSADDPIALKVSEATKIAKTKRPDLLIDGEMQLDAAIVASVAAKKAPGSSVAGNANVLIFPDLNSGNIGYKLTERFSKNTKATGPIFQGLNKPMNDLSRGCNAEDIFNTALMTIYQGKRG